MDPKTQPTNPPIDNQADISEPTPVPPPPAPLPEQPDAPVVSSDVEIEETTNSFDESASSPAAFSEPVSPNDTPATPIVPVEHNQPAPKVGLPDVTLNSLILGIGSVGILIVGIIIGLIF